MKSPRTKELIKDLSKKYGYSEKDIREMVSYQFKFLRKQMSSSNVEELDFKTVKLAHLGTFLVTENRLNHLKKTK